MNHQIEDHMDAVLISQLYPVAIAPQQGEAKPKRRRRKNKGGDNGSVGAKKRKLTAEQVNFLEQNFGDEHKLESERKNRLASDLGLDPRQVAVWFQNRRARWKNKKLEQEYANLKKIHETTIVEKCHLQSEVLKLKGQISEAEKELQRLAEPVDGVSSNSPTSSISHSVGAVNPPFLGEFGVDGFDDDVFYMAEPTYNVNGMEWMNNLYT